MYEKYNTLNFTSKFLFPLLTVVMKVLEFGVVLPANGVGNLVLY